MPQLKDVLLVGYGAVGAIYSLILKKGGQARVTVVARSNYDAVNAHGMDFQSKKYGDIKGWRPDRLFPSVAQALDRPYSHVVLVTKAIPEILKTDTLLAPLLSSPYADIHPQPTYVLLQNGLNVEVDLYEALKKLNPEEEPRIISTAVWIATRMLEKNVVEHFNFDRVSMGVYRPSTATLVNTPTEYALLKEFSDILSAGGSEITIVPEIQRVKYSKNFWNAIFGSSSALSRLTLHAIFCAPHLEPGASRSAPMEDLSALEPRIAEALSTPSAKATENVASASPNMKAYTIPFLYDAMTEIHKLGSVLFPDSELGPGLDPDHAAKMLEGTARLHAHPDNTHRPSMLVDVEMGRPMEVEHVVGELVRMGRKRGVDMPRIEALYALLLIMQDQLLRSYHERSKS